MSKDNNAYYVARLVILLSLIGIVLTLVGWMVSLNGRVNSVTVNLPSLSATSVNVQPLEYTSLLRDAPLSLSSSLTLSTISSSNLSAFKTELSKYKVYEITQANGKYYLSYPASFGTTYSLQMLSSPYPDRVLDIVKTLRSMGQPAFKIDYASQSALFLGVFPTSSEGVAYRSTLDSTLLVKIVGTKPSGWMIRRIP